MATFKNDLIVMNNGGTISGDVTGLNIAYGYTAPEDTSKLWIKTGAPSRITYGKAGYSNTYGIQFGITDLTVTDGCICACAVGTKIYMFGGSTDGAQTNVIQCYDTESGIITTCNAVTPNANGFSGASAIGTNIYIYFGANVTNSQICCYDTVADTITVLRDNVSSYLGRGSCVCNNKIYMFGGEHFNAMFPHQAGISYYDIDNDTIIGIGATLPEAAEYIRSVCIGEKIYLIGGKNEFALNTINIIDTTDNTVSDAGVTIPTALYSVGVASVGNDIFIFGGRSGTNESTLQSAIYKYDTVANTISVLDITLQTPSYEIKTAVVGTDIYLIGGRPNVNLISKFTAMYIIENNMIHIESSHDKNVFDIISTENITFSDGLCFVLKGVTDAAAVEVEAYLHNGTAWVRTT